MENSVIPEIVPNEAQFNQHIFYANLHRDFIILLAKGTLGSSSLQGLAVDHSIKAKEEFKLKQEDWVTLNKEAVAYLHREAKDLVKKLSYSFADLV